MHMLHVITAGILVANAVRPQARLVTVGILPFGNACHASASVCGQT